MAKRKTKKGEPVILYKNLTHSEKLKLSLKTKVSIVHTFLRELQETKRAVAFLYLDPRFPSENTFHIWLEETLQRDFYDSIMNSRGADFDEEVIAISDEEEGNIIHNKDGSIFSTVNMVAARKLRIDTRFRVDERNRSGRSGNGLDEDGNEPKKIKIIMNDYR